MQDENGLEIYFIPQNVIRSKKFLKFPKRNWIEGIIEAAIVAWLINLIPFVIKVKVITILVLCGTILFGNLVGIKNRSVIQLLTAFFVYNKKKAEYHYGRVDNYERKQKRLQSDTFENKTNAEKFYIIAKQKITEYLEKQTAEATEDESN